MITLFTRGNTIGINIRSFYAVAGTLAVVFVLPAFSTLAKVFLVTGSAIPHLRTFAVRYWWKSNPTLFPRQPLIAGVALHFVALGNDDVIGRHFVRHTPYLLPRRDPFCADYTFFGK
jgi:hypothetical protein